MQLTTQLAGARKQAVRLQAEVEAAHEAQRSVVGAKQSELMQAQLKLSETEQLAELYRQALTNSTCTSAYTTYSTYSTYSALNMLSLVLLV